MKKILVLGAGLVAGPAVRYLLEQQDIEVVLADQVADKARMLIRDHPRGKAIQLDVSDLEATSRKVAESDGVVSLLPWMFHPPVARMCLKHGKHMVTASYVQQEMRSLDREAREKGLIFLNEVGVDPGLDHMSAMQVIEQVKREGGRVDSLFSYCGGLPSLEANNNPLGYKFSWSPEGAMLAANNPGRYLEYGRIYEVPAKDLFRHYWLKSIPGAGVFEAYVNRDALPYRELYGIEDASGMYRGTLRNVGYCETWDCLKRLKLLDRELRFDTDRMSQREILAAIMRYREGDLRAAVAAYLDLPVYSLILKKLEWLGLFSRRKLGMGTLTAFEILAHTLKTHLAFDEGERDLLIMHHEFEVIYPGLPTQRIQSTLIDRGIPGGDTSMSRTVGYPVAIAARLVVAGKVPLTGVRIPIDETLYRPILAECEKLGIRFVERRSDLDTDERSYWGDRF